MSFENLLAEDRRLAILRLLNSDPDYAINESVMQMALEQLGHGVSRDSIRTDFAWLAEQGLITVKTVSDTIQVARLTARGGDAANGRARIPGVKRPAPGG